MRRHPLDRPVWQSLHSGWAHLALLEGACRRVDPDYGPFAASADPEAPPAELATLAQIGEPLWIVETSAILAPSDMKVSRTAELAQMVMAEPCTPLATTEDLVELGEPDAAEMRQLAELTRPGPFHRKTHCFGGFVGVRKGEQLVAMAGERMRLQGLAEVSGVCTHPDHRGCGHAQLLMRLVASRIQVRGETPFLHAYASNAGAIALYERLGFRRRRQMILTELVLG